MEITLGGILLLAIYLVWFMGAAITWMGILDKAGRDPETGYYAPVFGYFFWFRIAGFSRFVAVLLVLVLVYGPAVYLLNLSNLVIILSTFIAYWLGLSIFTLSTIRIACAFNVNWYWGLISAILPLVPLSFFKILQSKEKYENPLDHPEVLKEPKLYLVCSILLSFVSMVGMTLLYLAWQARDMPIN